MVLSPLVLFAACAGKPTESPATLTEMTQVLLEDFGTDAAPAEVEELVTWLQDNIDEAEEGYVLGDIGEDDVEGIEHSDTVDWEQVYGVGVPRRVRGTLDAYAAIVPETDQSFADPTYAEWTRSITAGTSEGFLAGGDLDTTNHIVKSGPLGVTIPYDARKDYRWYGDVLAFRTWVPEAGFGDDGNNGIVVGFTIELWYEDDEGVVWYNGQWTQLKSVVDDYADENFWLTEFIEGTIDYMAGTEAHANGEDAE